MRPMTRVGLSLFLAALAAAPASAQWPRRPAAPCCPTPLPAYPGAPEAPPSADPGASPAPRPGDPEPPPRPGDPETPQTPDAAQPPAPTPDTAGNQNVGALDSLDEAGGFAGGEANPTVFGDFLPVVPGQRPLIATLPGGTRVAIAAGQRAVLPAGTRLDRTVIVSDVARPGTTTRVERNTPLPTALAVTGGDIRFADQPTLPVNIIRGPYKVAENESPRPQDRVFAGYNYFSNVNQYAQAPGVAGINIHRYVIGVEKTLLGETASVGVRLPYFQFDNDPLYTDNTLGDLTFVLKGVIWEDPAADSDDLVSGGLVLTLPTGGQPGKASIDPEVHPTLIQPWVGGYFGRGDWFVQTFMSLSVPTDSRDVTYLFTDVQLGYRLYRSPSARAFVSSVSPIMEVHVNNPLNHRDVFEQPVGGADIVNLLAGTSVGLAGGRGLLNVGLAVPVTGPKPFDVEAMAQVGVRY